MRSFAEWHLIQFTQNMRRREPRNVGVVATDGIDWRLRLFAVDPRTAAVDGRPLRRFHLLKDEYAQWATYFQVMVSEGRIDQIKESQRRRPAEFRLVTGGHTELTTTLDRFVDTLYTELVAEVTNEVAEDRATVLQSKVANVLERAGIKPIIEPIIQGLWGDSDHEDRIRFDYSFTNGKLHLMDRLQLARPSLEQSKIVARDFNARARAVRDAGAANSFIAFYSGEVVNQIGDSVLTPLWKVGHTVDVDQPGAAARDLQDYIYA